MSLQAEFHTVCNWMETCGSGKKEEMHLECVLGKMVTSDWETEEKKRMFKVIEKNTIKTIIIKLKMENKKKTYTAQW